MRLSSIGSKSYDDRSIVKSGDQYRYAEAVDQGVVGECCWAGIPKLCKTDARAERNPATEGTDQATQAGKRNTETKGSDGFFVKEVKLRLSLKGTS